MEDLTSSSDVSLPAHYKRKPYQLSGVEFGFHSALLPERSSYVEMDISGSSYTISTTLGLWTLWNVFYSRDFGSENLADPRKKFFRCTPYTFSENKVSRCIRSTSNIFDSRDAILSSCTDHIPFCWSLNFFWAFHWEMTEQNHKSTSSWRVLRCEMTKHWKFNR